MLLYPTLCHKLNQVAFGCSDVVYPILCHKLNQHVSSHCKSRGLCVWADAASCFGSCLAVMSACYYCLGNMSC